MNKPICIGQQFSAAQPAYCTLTSMCESSSSRIVTVGLYPCRYIRVSVNNTKLNTVWPSGSHSKVDTDDYGEWLSRQGLESGQLQLLTAGLIDGNISRQQELQSILIARSNVKCRWLFKYIRVVHRGQRVSVFL